MQIVQARVLVEDETAPQFSTNVPDNILDLEIALMQEGMPFTSLGAAFLMSEVQAERQRLQEAGVRIAQPSVTMGPVTTAVFYDTCGNRIEMAQIK